jgi:hypothetical protein
MESFIDRHRIFLPVSVCELLDEHYDELARSIYIATIYGGSIKSFDEKPSLQRVEAFTKAYEKFETHIPVARNLLETEFRKMLGADSERS